MKHQSITIIRNEHAALASLLHTLMLLIAEHRQRQTFPDFDLIRAMLVYIDEYPERLHHPKESELLFPKIRQREPAAAEVLDQLDHDHAQGEFAIHELSHKLMAFEVLGRIRRQAFETALERYVDFYLKHMSTEEREVLPLAQRCLNEEDWRELDAAFADNRDPLTGHAADEPFRHLYSRIAGALPAPWGLGPAKAQR
jgi:hemerythrin-like domain-containing protein